MQLIIHPVTLILKDTFRIAHSKRDVQQTIIVELKENNISGYGEATVNTYFGITKEKIIAGIEKVRQIIENYTWGSPEDLHFIISHSIKNNHFALCAIDEACYDLYGKLNHTTTYQYLGLDITKLPVSDYTIGIDSIEKMVEKIKATPAPVYKIKVGTKDDIAIIKELRKHTDSVFRVDANCGWTVNETIENAAILKKLNVELIEQPLVPGNRENMKKIYQHSVLPLIADESCLTYNDIDTCAECFHGINIKLTKCGGITNAKKMLLHARTKGLKIMLGCMTESSVGISAAAQLLPLVDYADIDGSMLIANDVAEGVNIKKGNVLFPKRFGNGILWKKKDTRN